MTGDKGVLQQLYFESGLQYHIAARYAAIAGLLVSGNLFHHAIEMYLKGCLCKKLNKTQLKRLHHNLQDIWPRFKEEISDSTLDKFDETIAALDEFEHIRYPEEIAARGMMALIGFTKGDFVIDPKAPKRPEPTYELVIGELDALAEVIFEKASINPLFFTGGLNQDALTYLKRWNEAMIWK